jgi:hypothetical protein
LDFKGVYHTVQQKIQQYAMYKTKLDGTAKHTGVFSTREVEETGGL